MKLKYTGPFLQPTGVGRAFHENCHALLTQGIDLWIDPAVACDLDDLEGVDKVLENCVEPFDPTHVLIHSGSTYHAQVLIDEDHKHLPHFAYVTWEGCLLPKDAQKILRDHFRRVFVPGDLQRYGEIPATEVPHPIAGHLDTRKSPEEALARHKAEPFRFYSILTWCPRKNPIGLISTYFATCWNQPGAQLLLVIPEYAREAALTDIDALKDAMGLPQYPPVCLKTDLTRSELWTVHLQEHHFVTATRGEGWGLGVQEACVAGNLITAPWHVPAHPGVGYRATTTPVETPPPFDAPGLDLRTLWWEPDLQDLSEFYGSLTPPPPEWDYDHVGRILVKEMMNNG